MELIDFIVIAAICLIIGGAVAYIVKAKKSGKKCIGCPDGGSCHSSSNKGGCSGCCSSCSSCCGESTDTKENK